MTVSYSALPNTSTLCTANGDPIRFQNAPYFVFDSADHIAHSDNQMWKRRIKHGNPACQMSPISNLIGLAALAIKEVPKLYQQSVRSHGTVLTKMTVSNLHELSLRYNSAYHIPFHHIRK